MSSIKSFKSCDSNEYRVSNITICGRDGDTSSNTEGNDNSAPPFLVFKNLPEGFSKVHVYNMCSNNGTVTEVRDSRTNKNFFVDCKSVADQRAIYNALQRNPYNIIVDLGVRKKQHEGIYKNRCSNSSNSSFSNSADMIDKIKATRGTDIKAASLGNCENCHKLCDLTCSKCGYYFCGAQCQIENWLQHRRVCGKQNVRNMNCETSIYTVSVNRQTEKEDALAKNEIYKTNIFTMKLHANVETKKQEFEEDEDEDEDDEDEEDDEVEEGEESEEGVESEDEELEDDDEVEDEDDNKDEDKEENEDENEVKYKKEAIKKNLKVELETLPSKIRPKNQNNVNNGSLPLRENQNNTNLQSYDRKKTSDFGSRRSNVSQNLSSFSYERRTSDNFSNLEKDATFITPKTGSIVSLVNISKSNLVFVKSKERGTTELYNNLLIQIHNDCKNMKKLSLLPGVGEFVAIFFKERYHRALVLSNKDESHIKVLCVDYGGLTFRSLSDLYECPKSCIHLPQLVGAVLLKDVPDVIMTKKLTDFMTSYLDKTMEIAYDAVQDKIPNTGMHKAYLIDNATNTNFNKAICTVIQSEKFKNSKETLKKSYLENVELPTGDDVELVIMNNSSLFVSCIKCTTVENALEIQRFQKEIQKYGESSEETKYDIRLKELCIAKYTSSKWCRGFCIELKNGADPVISFFDYGDTKPVNVENIRRYPKHFTFPIYTADCGIEKLPDFCEPELVLKLEEYLPTGKTVKFDHVKVLVDNNHFYTLTFSKLINKLQRAGFLEKHYN